MVFSSPTFLFFFFPITLILYFIVKSKYKNFVLLAASLLFYAWGEPKYILLMLLSITFNYIIARLIDTYRSDIPLKKVTILCGVGFNIWLLTYFKYWDFLLSIVNRILELTNSQISFSLQEIALPIGISFFTFQIMSYVIDVYRNDVPVQKNIFHLALYVSLFPQLIAGPIVRYIDVQNEIEHRTESLDKFVLGMTRFAIGFSKKILVANTVSKIADAAFGMPSDTMSVYFAWIGIICYSLQIYFDFSAYSDMAIGLGQIFGFTFLENFNYPYISKSIQEFWRRWHISLSTWFRDYLYIPLGGNRKSTFITYRNLCIVFLVTGIWHGASWNFVFWGLFHGFFLIIERAFLGKLLKKIPAIFQHVYSLTIVIVGWVFFRADSFTHALAYLKAMFLPNNSGIVDVALYINSEIVFFMFCGVLFSIPVLGWVKKIILSKMNSDFIQIGGQLVIIALFLVSISYMAASNGYNPFIYFRF